MACYRCAINGELCMECYNARDSEGGLNPCRHSNCNRPHHPGQSFCSYHVERSICSKCGKNHIGVPGACPHCYKQEA